MLQIPYVTVSKLHLSKKNFCHNISSFWIGLFSKSRCSHEISLVHLVGWLVDCFGFNDPLRQYFSLYRVVSQREEERGEKGQRRVKMSKQPPPAPTASAIGPCPTIIQIVGRPGTGSLPRTIAPPDHPRYIWNF